jgi:hypothetical protein
LGRATANTGSSGSVVLDLIETATNVAENWSEVSWYLYLDERSINNSTWNGNQISAYVADWWSGTFNFDWRPGGAQSKAIASGVKRVYHNADGTGQVTVTAGIGNTGTSGAGGPTNVTNTLGLTTLVRTPNTPTAVFAKRLSDTQVELQWHNEGQVQNNDIESSLNDGPFGNRYVISAAERAVLAIEPNQKVSYWVRVFNSAGLSDWSRPSVPVYTTPAAPTNVVAAKNAAGDIVISFTDNVAYAEHVHAVQHGVVTVNGITWDGSDTDYMGLVQAGSTSYTHAQPDPSVVHVYRVRANGGGLDSTQTVSEAVRVLVAPNKPTLPAMPANVATNAPLTIQWTHNAPDTTPQTAYEVSGSTDGGATWASPGKITSNGSQYVVAAGTYAANTTLTVRVRTWGSATTGGSDGKGASPWSDLRVVGFRTAPTASINSPANGAEVPDATLRVSVGFGQPEGAKFVKAQLELVKGGVTIETMDSSIAQGITLKTKATNASTYTVRARVQDSNGVWSAWVSSTFSVVYLAPVPADVAVKYLEENGFAQVTVKVPAPGAGQAAATRLTLTRTIGSQTDTMVSNYATAAELVFIDTTPVINGINVYTATVTSSLGAQSVTTKNLITRELRRAFLSRGPSFSTVGVFGANLDVDEDLVVANDTIVAAGRTKPIGLYGTETAVRLKVKSFIYEEFGSTVDWMRAVLLLSGKACYRDASGRRLFGTVQGSLSYKKAGRADLSFTIDETS